MRGGAMKKEITPIVKTIAKRDMRLGSIKNVFSLLTVCLVTALLLSLALYESGYETAKDRAAAGQPQVVFCDLSAQQAAALQADEDITSITLNESGSGLDASVTLFGAEKMTQTGFSDYVTEISAKYGIRHAVKNTMFLDSLSDGNLFSSERLLLVGVALFVLLVSALVIYNIFYLSIATQIRQFGQFRTIGMTAKQISGIIRTERKLLCGRAIPVGLVIGTFIGYLLQPKGFAWKPVALWGIVIALVVTLVVQLALNQPTKIASSITPARSARFLEGASENRTPRSRKRKLSAWGLARIHVTGNRKRVMVSVLSLALSGLLFTLAATYTTSVDAKAIVERELYQYGQFIVEESGLYAQSAPELDSLTSQITKLPGVQGVKKVTETGINWSAGGSSDADQLSIIEADDMQMIQPFIRSGEADYQQLAAENQILAVDGAEGITLGSSVALTFEDGTTQQYTVGAILDGSIYHDTAVYGGWFLLPRELLPETPGMFAVSTKLIVDADNAEMSNVEANLRDLLKTSDQATLTTKQEAIIEKDAAICQVSLSVVGITLLFLCFSILTFANTILMNITVRKNEYAMLQSIGMTYRQVRAMQIMESILEAGIGFVITLVLGIVLGIGMIQALTRMGMFYLTYTFPFAMFALYCAVTVIVLLAITFIAFNSMQKAPLVERMRVAE